MKARSGSPLGLYTVGTAALFLAGFLLLVMFGARTYRDVAANQTGNNDARALLSYLSTCVRGSDRAGRVSVQDSAYGPVLTVGDSGSYALRIYQYDGQLLEEYRSAGTELDPENATILGSTSTFLVDLPTPDTLKITTDAGDVLLYLRSGGAMG